jgi:UDP-N-acetylglucosamine--N-acetylmuramyl-(pentapeptide) pyrophosphoryl-undecaprenol N-acetylglucosamine transferase
MDKRVLITVGGTGGHIYPALALARKLKEGNPQITLLFVGGGLRKNRYFAHEEFLYEEIPSGTFCWRKPFNSFVTCGSILRGIWQSFAILRRFQPDIVVGFGSYHTLPLLIAAVAASVPIILHEANRIPGKVNRLISRYAKVTGVHFPDTARWLKGRSAPISLPLRHGFRLGSVTRAEACRFYGIDPTKKTLLVFGGSQGAYSLNQRVSEALLQLPPQMVQVLHFTGDLETARALREQYIQHGLHAVVKEFEARMELAWQAADCMIARAGASTLAEQIEFEVPGILVPYPHAADNHQEANADFFVDVVKGGLKWLEQEKEPQKLADLIRRMGENQGNCLKQMQEAIKHYKQTSAAQDLSSIVKNYRTF